MASAEECAGSLLRHHLSRQLVLVEEDAVDMESIPMEFQRILSAPTRDRDFEAPDVHLTPSSPVAVGVADNASADTSPIRHAPVITTAR
eukprot:m.227484 g.227484  ORF g.227484 m.227484 type:complete len:89 (+) comp19243_c0_seq3:2642-2908(+)